MACACFTRNCQSSRSVRDAPGLFCQGCARSVPVNHNRPSPHLFSELRILKKLGAEIMELRILKNLGADAKPKTESGKCWGTGGRAAASFRKEKSGRGYVASTMQDGSMPVSSC